MNQYWTSHNDLRTWDDDGKIASWLNEMKRDLASGMICTTENLVLLVCALFFIVFAGIIQRQRGRALFALNIGNDSAWITLVVAFVAAASKKALRNQNDDVFLLFSYALSIMMGAAPFLESVRVLGLRRVRHAPCRILSFAGFGFESSNRFFLSTGANLAVTTFCYLTLTSMDMIDNDELNRLVPGLVARTALHHLFFTTYVHRGLVGLFGELGAIIATAYLSTVHGHDKFEANPYLIEDEYKGVSGLNLFLMAVVCESYASLFSEVTKDEKYSPVAGWASWPGATAAALLYERVMLVPQNTRQKALEELDLPRPFTNSWLGVWVFLPFAMALIRPRFDLLCTSLMENPRARQYMRYQEDREIRSSYL